MRVALNVSLAAGIACMAAASVAVVHSFAHAAELVAVAKLANLHTLVVLECSSSNWLFLQSVQD